MDYEKQFQRLKIERFSALALSHWKNPALLLLLQFKFKLQIIMLKMQIFNFSFTLSLFFLLCPLTLSTSCSIKNAAKNRQTLPVERLVEAAAALQQKNRLPANNHFSPLVQKRILVFTQCLNIFFRKRQCTQTHTL